MADSSVYAVRLPEDIKERITKNQQDSGQSPAEFMARIVAQYEATNYGKSELAALQSAFDVINKVVIGLTAGASAQATAAAESSASYLTEIDSLTKQLDEAEATQKAAEIKAAEDLAAATAELETVCRDLAEHKAAQAAAAEMQTELAIMVKAQREQIATLQAALAATQQQ